MIIHLRKVSTSEQADVVSLSGFKGDEKVDLSKGKKLVAIFNMACDHCIEVALKLSAVKSRVKLLLLTMCCLVIAVK